MSPVNPEARIISRSSDITPRLEWGVGKPQSLEIHLLSRYIMAFKT